ncbi:hypothetical protein P879_09621 [Paragonimus westermani]|uniref:hydroxymethylbilane synthase n=1 Tax=Paragonimus westermani TaxID=34504 RepID=A0A8T0DID3_9TREM|nr:hypothetical protein P879_09621 [Paragonimus westermani]
MPTNDERIIRVGSRRSQLALIQTNIAINLLKDKHPNLRFEVVKISTIGDKILDIALSKIGDKSLFTKELENALMDDVVDFVVHSLKDVPTGMPPGLVLGCVFDRTSPDDVVLMSPSNRGRKLSDLPEGSIVGTSALRRVATLTRLYPHLNFVSIRGNLNTRLKKLDEECAITGLSVGDTESPAPLIKYDAIILAKAGIQRLGWSDRIDQVLDDCYHAVSQGALACECRQNDDFILSVLADLHNESAALSCVAERSLMRHLDGGCSTPIGVRTRFSPNTGGHPWFLQLHANVLSTDGTECVKGSILTELPYRITQERKRCNSSDVYQESPSLARRSKIPRLTFSSADNSSSSTTSNPSDKLVPPMDKQLNVPQDPTEDELCLASDSSSVFMGIHVRPTCAVARLRMARAQRLGSVLAAHLLTAGADRILDEIRSKLLPKPSDTTFEKS